MAKGWKTEFYPCKKKVSQTRHWNEREWPGTGRIAIVPASSLLPASAEVPRHRLQTQSLGFWGAAVLKSKQLSAILINDIRLGGLVAYFLVEPFHESPADPELEISCRWCEPGQ